MTIRTYNKHFADPGSIKCRRRYYLFEILREEVMALERQAFAQLREERIFVLNVIDAYVTAAEEYHVDFGYSFKGEDGMDAGLERKKNLREHHRKLMALDRERRRQLVGRRMYELHICNPFSSDDPRHGELDRKLRERVASYKEVTPDSLPPAFAGGTSVLRLRNKYHAQPSSVKCYEMYCMHEIQKWIKDVRSKISHFRILIIGRANAGKTTILKKVCNSVENPEIYDTRGRRIDPEIVKESAERGEHDIENQLIFKSNPQFIFHDSRGFEGGSADEIQKVTTFIEERAETTELAEQLHAIWYSSTDRLKNADNATGSVYPPTVIGLYWKLKIDMRQEHSNCIELINETAKILTDDALLLLFVSVQRNNIDLCIWWAVHYALDEEGLTSVVKWTLALFPHV
ncbi:GTP-binding protein [Mycena sanguinolenta]|uniref:GTP-binding protein n=1 Tax=Mycena sanguinolenta TaxID=230812 RepID=A0A8H6XNG1_9AGAR|nr:GTP-binding protein [Mycena sanguinolenta]